MPGQATRCTICQTREAIATGLCANCYSYLRRWMRTTPRRLMSRLEQVQLFEKRLETILRSTNVRSATTHRRRRRA